MMRGINLKLFYFIVPSRYLYNLFLKFVNVFQFFLPLYDVLN